jgi:hypothetical protein
MHTFFAIDEYTDVLDPKSVRVLCDLAYDAVLRPNRSYSPHEHPVGEMTRQ